ncbi:DUF983 domain-containing protein [Sinomicrobium pectinilyticum]|uniref:DUF983 domain-containing protein n=1 Tax=Sinomicrobium pectinilyticum TaxID=1084421 RepID=A0A3N0E8A6_SINP1|nr:DUF983 domain-containing protein [Sinomicrobium pectinilyticum]RNL84085.1 DUF983 domain-containing protein [Sinomicrobium pectinilyticum]
MFKRGTRLYSILTGSCPKCQQESMYADKNLYNPYKTLKMNEKCSHCGTRYKIEPSFFYGAMYVSYAVGTAFAVAAFVISFLLIGTGLKTAFFAIMGTLIVFMPVIMRLSRNIWINFFIKYDPSAGKQPKASGGVGNNP